MTLSRLAPHCRAALALLLLLGMGNGIAQAVYRCGSGGNEYSTTPCSDGRVVDTDDSRSEAQRQEAADAARRARDLAVRLRRERQAENAAALTPRLAGSLSAPRAPGKPAADKAKKAHHPKPKKERGAQASEAEGLSEPVRVPGGKPAHKAAKPRSPG